MSRCKVCFRHCEIHEGELGYCGARTCVDGAVVAANYGLLTALALDPIEKKPLRRFHPGSMILSVGSYGCNLRCPFCQNNSISWSREAMTLAEACRKPATALAQKAGRAGGRPDLPADSMCAAAADRNTTDSASSAIRRSHLPPGIRYTSPKDLARIAADCRDMGNIGIAFTYNEPLVGYEFVRDTARLVHEQGMKNVLVTNGTAEPEILEELLPWIDAMNIDLKSFDEQWYRDVAGGSLSQVRGFIELAAKHCHVELTTLIIPGENDSDAQMLEQTEWIAGLTDAAGRPIGRGIPLHITRFFPQFHMIDRPPTDINTIRHLADLAAQRLDYVYMGNC